MANSVNHNQTAPICSVPRMFASILNLSVMLGNYLQQQTTSADYIFRCISFLGSLRVNMQFGLSVQNKSRRLISEIL